jgi:imidazolonepropionase-like amidohydrolase
MRHGENALEPILMVEAGMTNAEAIAACTSHAAAAIGLGDITGLLEPGKTADLIVVDGNPLKDINILANQDLICMVMRGGEILKNNLQNANHGDGELPAN